MLQPLAADITGSVLRGSGLAVPISPYKGHTDSSRQETGGVGSNLQGSLDTEHVPLVQCRRRVDATMV